MVEGFFKRGWAVFPPEPLTIEWIKHARKDAVRALEDPKLDHWYQCERTWFVGLDALANDTEGRVGGSLALSGRAVEFVHAHCGGWPELHSGQVSGVFPGYPRPREDENNAAFRYRLNRDAAHVDGVLGVGVPKRRFVREPHAFIFGVSLTEADASAAPLVVWEGSHLIMKSAFERAFVEADGAHLDEIDVTEVYQNSRRTAFETCARKVVWGPPGSVFVLHRLMLHGVAPWTEDAQAAPEGRLIAYFRPPMRGGARQWVDVP